MQVLGMVEVGIRISRMGTNETWGMDFYLGIFTAREMGWPQREASRGAVTGTFWGCSGDTPGTGVVRLGGFWWGQADLGCEWLSW